MEDDQTPTPEKDSARGKSPRLGPAGEAVRANVRRLRDAQGISGAKLSAQLEDLGRPIPLVGIQRIESGERRVDVDDLVALAVALRVSPVTLLMPECDSPTDTVEIVGIGVPAGGMWEWLRADGPILGPIADRRDYLIFASRALPRWELERLATLLREQSPLDDLASRTITGSSRGDDQ